MPAPDTEWISTCCASRLIAPSPVAAGAAGGVAVAQTGSYVRHAWSPIQRHDLDTGRPMGVGVNQQFAAAAVAEQVLRQFRYHDRDPAGLGLVVANLISQPDCATPGRGDVGRVADLNAFHGAISNARW